MHDKLQYTTVAETQQLGYSLAEQCYCIYCWNSNTHTHTQTPCDCAWHKSPTKNKKETVPQKICQQSQSVTATSMYSTYITHTHTYRICTQVSDLNAAHIYACLRACVWVRVCVCSIPVRCCSTLCHGFLRVSLSLAAVPSSTSRTTTAAPISRSLLNAFSLFRYCVFCFCYCFFCSFYHNVRAPQQTSPPQNWPIRARHLQRARPRLRRVRAGGWKVGGELGGGIL